MPYSRRYTLTEIKGMLQIYRNNRQVTGVGPGHVVQRSNAEMHAQAFHGGASMLDLTQRVNTPGQPRTSGTYWNEDDQAAATLEIINSMAGQIALRRLDIGEGRAPIEAALTPNRYRMSSATDASMGFATKASPARVGAGAVHTTTFATKGFVLCLPGVAGQLQIQTSYPIA
jgi:hypothetical protein